MNSKKSKINKTKSRSMVYSFLIKKGKKIMQKIIYTLKQLLPLTYYSKYKVQNGVKELAIWTQWFGKPFHIKRYTLAD